MRKSLILALGLAGCSDVVPCQGARECDVIPPPARAEEALGAALRIWGLSRRPDLRWVVRGDCTTGFMDRGECVQGLFLPYSYQVWLDGTPPNTLWWALPHEALHATIWEETGHRTCDPAHDDGRWGEPLEMARAEMVGLGY